MNTARTSFPNIQWVDHDIYPASCYVSYQPTRSNADSRKQESQFKDFPIEFNMPVYIKLTQIFKQQIRTFYLSL